MDIIIALICLATIYQPIILHTWYFMAVESSFVFFMPFACCSSFNSHSLTCHLLKVFDKIHWQQLNPLTK